MEHASESELSAHVRRLEQRIDQMERIRSASPKDDAETTPTRRNLFRLGAAGVAGAVVAAASHPSPATAACGPPLYIGCGNDGTAQTTLYCSEPGRARFGLLNIYNVGGSSAELAPESAGLIGSHTSSDGVIGISYTGRSGVRGIHQEGSSLTDGTAGVYGEHRNTDGFGTGVIGKHNGAGWGMWATSVSGKGLHADGGSGIGAEGVTTGATANSFGVVARVTATGPNDNSAAIRAISSSTTAGSTAIRASHAGSGTSIYGSSYSGTGVRGVSPNGRGGVFAGARAQVNLTPGALATHPTDGVRGDLYMDSTGNLWLCKTSGSTATWVQLG